MSAVAVKSKGKGEPAELGNPGAGGDSILKAKLPITVSFRLRGVSDLLFHRWDPEYVDEKAKAAKGSTAKKTDELERYVYRMDRDEEGKPVGNLAIPGEYVRQSILGASRYKQDPRSPRKSALDLFKASIVALTELADLGKPQWDYEDKRRVVVQRNGINRTRPALKAGWEAEFSFMLMQPNYVGPDLFHEVLVHAGQLVGLADFRPTYGRFSVVQFKQDVLE